MMMFVLQSKDEAEYLLISVKTNVYMQRGINPSLSH